MKLPGYTIDDCLQQIVEYAEHNGAKEDMGHLYIRDCLQRLINPKQEALEAIWPFCEDEYGQYVTKKYADALQKVAHAIGRKEFVLKDRGNHMFYVDPSND